MGTVCLATRIVGAGSPVLLLHGLTASAATWRRVVPRLAGRHTVVAPDLAGRGDSPAPAGLRYRLRDEVHRLRVLLRRLGLDRVTVAGHSWGAALALALEATGDEVDGLVLANPVTPWTRRPPILGLLDLLPATPGLAGRAVPLVAGPVTRAVLRRRVFTGRAEPSEDDVRASARPWRRPELARTLPAVASDWNPAALRGYLPPGPLRGIVLAGACDRRIRSGDAARLARRLGMTGRLVPETGHALPLERPGVVARAVSRFAVAGGPESERAGSGASSARELDQRTGGGRRE